MNHLCEQWRPVVGYEGLYSVSSLGRVRSHHYGDRVVSTHLDNLGYPAIGLSSNNKRVKRRVHSLMLTAFVGPRPEGMVARHLDDNRSNNIIENLAWGTPLENSQDKYRNGRGNQHLGKTHCVNGHELSPENLCPGALPKRACRICRNERCYAYKKRKKAAAG